MSGPFEVGERVLLIDQRDRTYLFRLEAGGTFHTHSGTLDHGALIGAQEGTRLETSRGMVLRAYRPRYADFVLKMPRGAQVIYPKDVGPIVMYADVFPGARVLEAGTGSGALTIGLCRAVGTEGSVVSYDVRDEHRHKAIGNVEAFFGKMPDILEIRGGDLSEVAGTGERYDRVVLDMPEPWVPLPALAQVLEPGGVVCAYLPTTVQVQQLVLALPDNGFQHIETFETLKRGWHVTERSMRPDHRMVGHTGFISIARREAR
ncbi:MAG: tRNA (adenine-N1)-methyltransferase [Actinomycetota bacterium]|nr:tRNA (adenine-N1)-methyltransferase [Actinomycetota bacterium]MDH5223592.1 tRNA (adenine-N1)-methyltransferase [Actinomycetota bacterium]MDH5314106.1 tRNA (adenine-N1)-methyltransferase [Actinomycetota bacterium]